MPVHKCRVLLVDDHPQVRQTLRTLLLPHEDVQVVAEAADGMEAIEMIGSCHPDIVLMDINMPRMNGIEAAGIIKKSWTETVIIGLCVVQDAYIVDAFLKSGATAVISKDRFDDLYGTIQRACLKKVSSPQL
jgi:DNA-binding NarL/FixJ family response regulator